MKLLGKVNFQHIFVFTQVVHFQVCTFFWCRYVQKELGQSFNQYMDYKMDSLLPKIRF